MTNAQLKAHCEDVIANPQDHLDWVVDMARVALASLEAVPVEWRLQCWDDTVPEENRWFDYERYKHRVTPGKNQRVIQYFTAPPVAELKPIELPKPELSSAKGVLLYADDVIAAINAAGYECEVKS